MIPFLPESPRYLANVGKHDLAAYNLAALRGDYPETKAIADELKEIRYAIEVESREAGSWSDIFRDGGVSGFMRVAVRFAQLFYDSKDLLTPFEISFSANFFQQFR